ncbi:hypothetical protein [Cryptosporangium phraense]|uniref:YopA central domain-containing protein n=1 Tax=Cryptosporangium phraense TaxID=2593070 RepID=A0A545APB4_9ACTN|nr:hypothetical protein [Cryptosporangium phraense]TQS43157.1 hypothetical protein FL583_20115 [Cryptosporangium phraense]
MRTHSIDDPALPLDFPYAFNQPGEPIRLYTGSIAGFDSSEMNGRVFLHTVGTASLRWEMDVPDDYFSGSLDEATLSLAEKGLASNILSFRRQPDSGWINSAEIGSSQSTVRSVIVGWLNVPSLPGWNYLIAADGRRWPGRISFVVGEWEIAIDQRPDHREAFRNLDDQHYYLLTHVMEIRRSSGCVFEIAAAENIIEALRITLSFMLGRWVSPALAIAYDLDGKLGWESWKSPICDPARRIGLECVSLSNRTEFMDLLVRSTSAVADEVRQGVSRFRMQASVTAAQTSFVEQRILAAFPALENIAWEFLTLSGGGGGRKTASSRRQYGSGANRLRETLRLAGIPLGVNASALPALSRFAADQGLPDGPAALVKVRNELVHPKELNSRIYGCEGLMRDSWMLSRHYLALLIMFSTGFGGSFVNHLTATWVGEEEPVPWSIAERLDSTFIECRGSDRNGVSEIGGLS